MAVDRSRLKARAAAGDANARHALTITKRLGLEGLAVERVVAHVERHETQLADNRALAFTFADADGTLVAIPEEVVRVLETLPDSGQLHERINTAARIAADQR